MKPFELFHVREFGDGCASYRAMFNRPMNVRELIEYALSRKRERGYIQISGERVFEYAYGKTVFDNITPVDKDRGIVAMSWYGGWSRADYCITL